MLIFNGRSMSKTSILRRHVPDTMAEAFKHKVRLHVKKLTESGCRPGLPNQQRLKEAEQKEAVTKTSSPMTSYETFNKQGNILGLISM
jgi:3-methyladenine DNA glycosylase AlkC